jgi:5-methylcytosine-specific restriction enzyme subunit McrC
MNSIFRFPNLQQPSLAAEVFSVSEHGEIRIEADRIFRGDKLLLDPAVEKSGYLAISLDAGRIKLRATSWVGFIPLNQHVAIQVRPRVPISVMHELLSHVSSEKQRTIPLGYYGYGQGDLKPSNLTELLARRLIHLSKLIRLNGLDFEYVPETFRGTVLIGAPMPVQTRLRQLVTHNPRQSVSRAWKRSVDTKANRAVLATLSHLYSIYQAQGRVKGAPAMCAALAEAKTIFSRTHVNERRLRDIALAPMSERAASRPDYAEASALALAIFSGVGIDPTARGEIRLAPVVVNLEDAFECFLRARLTDLLSVYGLSVFDGNINDDNGHQRKLYRQVKLPEARSIEVKPDILIMQGKKTLAVMDVKYRPYSGKAPDRSDVEQVITYAGVYGARHAIIAVPQRPNEKPSVIAIGKVGMVSVSVLAIDLNTANLSEELAGAVEQLMQRVAPQLLEAS